MRGRASADIGMMVLIAGVVAPLTGARLHAQEPQTREIAIEPGDAAQPQVVTFDEAIELAMDQNLDLRRARADLELRGALETAEQMDFLPDLSLSSGVRRSFGRSFSEQEGSILSETSDLFDAGVSASLNLFDGFEKVASLRASSLREDASRFRLRRTRQDVVFQVVQGFSELLLARELAEVREQELAAAAELLEQVRRLVEVGRQPVSDRYQQEAVHAEAEALLVEAIRQVELAEIRLMQVLQLDPLAEYEFRTGAMAGADGPDGDAGADSLIGDAEAYDLERLLQLAFERRADLAALEAAVDASASGVMAARSGYWPSLDLSFRYGSNWSSNSLQPIPGTGSPPRTVLVTPDDGGEPIRITVPGSGIDPVRVRPSFMDQLDGRRGGSVALSLNVPVFDRLQTSTQVQQAEVARLNARYDLQEQRQQVALEVRQALLDYRSALAQERASDRRLQAAQRAWEAAERRYELGAGTFVEVAQARAMLAAARSAAVRAQHTVLLTRRLIAYYTGTLDTDDPLTEMEEGGASE